MEKTELVKNLKQKLNLESAQAEHAVDTVIAELVSPFVLRKPGGQVGLLDNSCTNNCKEPQSSRTVELGR